MSRARFPDPKTHEDRIHRMGETIACINKRLQYLLRQGSETEDGSLGSGVGRNKIYV
jgi:hypothetical protein